MLANNQNVVKLNNSEVYKDISIYLDSLEKRTRLSYETNIRQFFKHITKGRDIEFLTENDLKLKRNDVLAYRNHLKEEGLANGTINQKIASLTSLYRELQANDYDVNSYVFEIKRLKDIPNSYGEISLEEAEMMAEAVFITESTKPLTKHLMIKFATRTSFRLDEILRITWQDFEEFEGVYKVTSIGKAQKKRTTSISSKFYNDLLLLKEENKKYSKWKKSNELLFQLNESTVNDMMGRIKTHLNIPKERNVVFHSLRAVSMNFEMDRTGGNLKKVIEHSGHSSMDTLYKHYISKNRDFTDTPGVKIDEEINWDFLNNLSTEDFKNFFIQNNYKFYNDIKKFSKELKD